MKRKISYLDEMSANSSGVHIVERIEDFSPFQGPQIARKPEPIVEPIDMSALRASFLSSLTPFERGFSSREWLESEYASNWDKNMSYVTNVILSIDCFGQDRADCWSRVNTFFTENQGLTPFHGAGGNKGFEATIAIGAFNYLKMEKFIAHLESLEWQHPTSFQIIYRTQDESNFLTINVLGKGPRD